MRVSARFSGMGEIIDRLGWGVAVGGRDTANDGPEKFSAGQELKTSSEIDVRRTDFEPIFDL